MRREGRQHGIVRTYRILPPPLNPRLVNSSTSPTTSTLFTKLPSKPPTKAHRKVWSGQVHWLRSSDIASSSYKLLTWRVLTGPGPVLNLPGLLDLNGDGDHCEDNGEEAEVETMKRENRHNSDKEGGGPHDDESMSFYDVGMMMEHVLDDDEDDDWCLV